MMRASPENLGATSEPCQSDAWQAAIDYGIDVSQIEYLLTLTPTERLERHEQAAGKRYYGFDPRHPETAE
jgi:hypothetical protein